MKASSAGWTRRPQLSQEPEVEEVSKQESGFCACGWRGELAFDQVIQSAIPFSNLLSGVISASKKKEEISLYLPRAEVHVLPCCSGIILHDPEKVQCSA